MRRAVSDEATAPSITTPSKPVDVVKTPQRRGGRVVEVTPPASHVTPSNTKKRSRKLQSSPAASASPPQSQKKQPPTPVVYSGTGTSQSPFRMSLRSLPNVDECMNCPTDRCCCSWFSQQLEKVYKSIPTKRITSVAGKRDLCAKSVLPPFINRMINISQLNANETFYDFGCGNGSVLFQVAYVTGARCVGVELSPHNATVAREAWAALKPILEKKAGHPMPEVEIVTGDLGNFIADDKFVAEPCVVWTANLLMPRSVTHFMSERFRMLPPGSRILAFDDLYPHSRSVAAIRDPDAFRKFEMVDYIWQEMSVEWTASDGRFFFYRRTKDVSVPVGE